MTDKSTIKSGITQKKKKSIMCNLNYIKENRQTRFVEHKHEEVKII